MKKLISLIGILLITLSPTFAQIWSQYFKSLPIEDQKRIKLINSLNHWVVSIVWKQQVYKYTYKLLEIEDWLYVKVPQWVAKSWEQIVSKWTWFLITKDWYIMTNKHVVSDPKLTYEIITYDGKSYPLDKIYKSDDNDLCLIKIAWTNFSPLKMVKSTNIMIWQSVIAIWNALWEYQNTVTQWIISWINRNLVAMDWEWWQIEINWTIQTDASINPWNSWWPLIDSNWNVIWINTAIDSQWQNIWFSIPTNQIFEFLKKTFWK